MTTDSYRTGSMQVLVPSRLSPNDAQDFIRREVRNKLAGTNEWPVRVSARTGVRHSAGVMSYVATFETGPVGVEYY